MFNTLEDAIAANEAAGMFFFTPDTMSFFDSKVEGFYPSPDGAYFTTSEQFDDQSPRLWTVRHITDNGKTDTIGEFQEYTTPTAANVIAAGLASAPVVRSLHDIATEIMTDWAKPYFGATPYVRAMITLDRITDQYGADSADSIVRYFLANAGTWRGETARRVKAELKGMLA
jgi:hypothetical protein